MRLFRVRCLALNYLLFWRRISNGELFRFSIIAKNIIIPHLQEIKNFIAEKNSWAWELTFWERRKKLWHIFEERNLWQIGLWRMKIDKTPSWEIKIKVQIDRIVENIQKIPEKSRLFGKIDES